MLRFAPWPRRTPVPFCSIRPNALSDEPDGSLTVRFRAGGFLEIAHHLMTWGPDVTILAPQALKD